jgi:hypothetical protein
MNTLLAFIPCAPYSAHERRGVGRRGLHQLISEAAGLDAIVEAYCWSFSARATEHGVQLAPAFHLPWGREMGFVPVDGHQGQFTDMRADSTNIANADSRFDWLSPALSKAIIASLVQHNAVPAVYCGGNPSSMSLASAGLIPMHHMGITLVGDATAIQPIGTPMLDSLIRANASHEAGRGGRVLVEANWVTDHRLPCVAASHLWGNDGRYTFNDAPAGSGVLFRQGVNEIGEWDLAEAAVGIGLDLWVNLDVTGDTARLFALVGGASK